MIVASEEMRRWVGLPGLVPSHLNRERCLIWQPIKKFQHSTVPNPFITNINKCSVFLFKHLLWQVDFDHSTCVHTVVGFQLVLEAEFLPTAVTFIGLLPGVDAFVALQRALISKAAPAELTLVWVVPC